MTHSILRFHMIQSAALVCLWLLPASAHAQGTITASEALRNIQKEYGKVKDYSADLNVVVNIPGVKMPPMDAKIYFKKPDKLHLDAKGFAMLPRDIVGFNPGMFSEDAFDAVIQGEETIGSTRCLKLKLLAKSDTMRLQRAMLYVDQDRWIILRMTSDPLQGNSGEANFTYALIDNKYLLPSTVKLEMMVPASIAGRGRPKMEKNSDAQKKSASVLLTYSNHRVNKGIDDSMFLEKKKD